FDQIVEKGHCCFLHHRIGPLLQEIAVTTEVVVIPIMEAQPRAAHWPDPRAYAIDWDRVPPEVRVVMNDEAARAVQTLCDPPAVFTSVFNEVEKRLVTMREVAGLRGPVVHLGVDVD